MRTGVVAVAAVALLTQLPAAAQPGATRAAAGRIGIQVDRGPLVMSDGVPAPPISPEIFGANARWIDNELGAWDPATAGPAAGFADAAHAADLGLIRYPGGTVANFFDFKKAIGPVAQRGCQTSGGFAAVRFGDLPAARNGFGPDEEESLVSQLGAKTMVMVPSINQTAQDAADYVEYMNSPSDGAATNPNGGTDWAEVRAANGHPAPYGIKTWEYGNEPFLDGQRYWRDQDPQTRVRQFIEGGWSRQTAASTTYQDDDGLFSGCDLVNRKTSTGAAGQTYRTRYNPIALPADATAASGPIAEPVLTVNGVEWKRVDSLATAGATDQVYQVGKADGTITFGDGAHGAIPVQGATLSIEYTTGRQDGFLDFVQAMKAVDPKITVCSGWGKPEFVAAMGTRPYDCIGIHSYTDQAGGDADGRYDSTELYQQLMNASDVPTQELAELRQDIARNFPDPRKRPALTVTEYGTISRNGPTGVKTPSNFAAMQMHNVYETALLIGQLTNGVRLSINSNLNGGPNADPAKRDWGNILGSPPGFGITGRSLSLTLAAPMIGAAPRQVTTTGNPVLPSQNYTAVVAAATRAHGGLQLLVVNRSLDTSMPITVDPAGGPAVKSARQTTVTNDDITAYNNDQAQPVQRTTKVLPKGQKVQADLPPHSVNLIELQY
jgi:alpha-N-arabinofuranosidase